MAITFVAGVASATNTSGTTTSGIDTTGANFLLVAAPHFNEPSITDSKGNTWSRLNVTGTDPKLAFWIAVNATVGASHTATANAVNCFSPVVFLAYSVVNTTSPTDQQNGGTATSSTTVTPGSITPSENNCLVVSASGSNTAAASLSSIDGGFSTRAGIAGAAGSYYGVSVSDLIQTSAAAANPTHTWSASGGLTAIIASFKAAVTGRANFLTLLGVS